MLKLIVKKLNIAFNVTNEGIKKLSKFITIMK